MNGLLWSIAAATWVTIGVALLVGFAALALWLVRAGWK